VATDRTDLSGRVAIVTGASRGIGLASAARLAEAGAQVVLSSRKQDALDEAAAGIGERAVGFAAHAADPQAAQACIAFTLERFGRLDILVNNAGTNPYYGPVIDVDEPRLSKTLDVNVKAPLLWTQLAWRQWMAEHGGSVVMTSSLGGLTVQPGLGVYNVSKAALLHLTRHLAVELAPKVRVNALAPGVVKTSFARLLWQDEEAANARIPLGRVGMPEDIAEAVLFLASDASSWMTGETMVIDGGAGHGRSPIAAVPG
jgi:NAD(P)-dependent dehydrogenase (short-subunit alcohol dehydrogenase family)